MVIFSGIQRERRTSSGKKNYAYNNIGLDLAFESCFLALKSVKRCVGGCELIQVGEKSAIDLEEVRLFDFGFDRADLVVESFIAIVLLLNRPHF